jgi:anti-sigma B factor antagonist
VSEFSNTDLEVAHHSLDGTLIVAITGELDVASADAVLGYISDLRPLRGRLQLDVSGLRFIDSSGVRALVAARRAAVEDTGQPIQLLGVTDMLRKVLTMMGLAEAFGVG